MKNITIAGNCTKDAVVRTTQSGQNVAGFSVAVNGYRNGAKTVDYFEISVWGKRADNVAQFAKKGAKISVAGDFYTDEYNGKTKLCIDASDWTPMGGGSQQGQSDNGGYGAGGQPGGDMDDEVPFKPQFL